MELIIFLVSFAIGWFGREQYAKHIVAQYIKHVAEQATKIKHTHVRIEKRDEHLFVYNADTNEFLAQGSTHKEVEELLFNRFPDVYFTASEDNILEVGYRNDTV